MYNIGVVPIDIYLNAHSKEENHMKFGSKKILGKYQQIVEGPCFSKRSK